MRTFLDGDFLQSILSTSHQAAEDRISEAVVSPEGLALFGEGAEVIGTWDYHVMVSNFPRLYWAEWTDSDDGVRFSDVEVVDVKRVSEAALTTEAVDTSRKIASAIFSGDTAEAGELTGDLLDMVHEGVPITGPSFVAMVEEWESGTQFRFRQVVESSGLSGGEASVLSLQESMDHLGKTSAEALELGSKDGRDIAELCHEAILAGRVSKEVAEAAEALGVAGAVAEKLGAVRSDVIATVTFADSATAALRS